MYSIRKNIINKSSILVIQRIQNKRHLRNPLSNIEIESDYRKCQDQTVSEKLESMEKLKSKWLGTNWQKGHNYWRVTIQKQL